MPETTKSGKLVREGDDPGTGYSPTPPQKTSARPRSTACRESPLSPRVLGKPIQSQVVVLGSMSLGGIIIPVESLAE